MATEAPFSHISEDAHLANLELIREADAVVVSDLHIGPGNLVNLEAATRALEWGKRVYLFSPRPMEERDHTGGEAHELYGRMLRAGAVEFSQKDALLDLLAGGGKEPG
jgi:iron complex transport system ATP-binding protein